MSNKSYQHPCIPPTTDNGIVIRTGQSTEKLRGYLSEMPLRQGIQARYVHDIEQRERAELERDETQRPIEATAQDAREQAASWLCNPSSPHRNRFNSLDGGTTMAD